MEKINNFISGTTNEAPNKQTQKQNKHMIQTIWRRVNRVKNGRKSSRKITVLSGPALRDLLKEFITHFSRFVTIVFLWNMVVGTILGDIQMHDPVTQMFSYFRKPSEEEDATKAELLFTGFLIEHNIQIAASDHAGSLFRVMFPDSQIAKKYGCGRTKTTAIIGELASNTSTSIADIAKSSPFSLATDGSNDGISESQLYPIMITYFDNDKGIVQTQIMLSLPECEGDSTSENIYKLY